MNEILKGQVAIVTGGSAGIGKAIALLFAQQGAHVCVLATNKEKGATVVAELEQATAPSRASFYQVDVSDTAAVKKVIDEILAKHGKVDIVVNNAGITRDLLLMKMTADDWDQVMNVNVKSCFNLCQALVRPMMKARQGRVINVSSVVGLTGNTGQANYAASKAAMIGFTKSLAKELGSRNITANCIAPGYIDTEMTAGLTEEWKKAIIDKTSLGRMGKPEDIAQAALFLASPGGAYITGQVLVVDGGMAL